MNPIITGATTTNQDGIIIPAANVTAVDSPFTEFFAGLEFGGYFDSLQIFEWLNLIWTGYAFFAYTISIIMLALYVYATTRYNQLTELRAAMIKERERIWDERFRSGPKNSRMEDILNHINSIHPNDWKLAIIEADIMLDLILKERGYAGQSLGERLRSISPSQLQSLDAAWQAHKVRNQVAHGGADFVLTKRLAEDTIKQYRQVFGELGVH